MAPFGIQIVVYLFLAGVAAGAALIGSQMLSSGELAAFKGGKRLLLLAILCAVGGSIFLILDLSRPADFLLILTSANPGSAISWGARILIIFTLCAILVWATIRNWREPEIENGFQGADLIARYLLPLAALALAIYPAFVLRQGAAFPLWQNPLLIPLIPVSALHSGVAAVFFLSACATCKQTARKIEIVLGVIQLGLLASLFIGEGASMLAWAVALVLGTLVPLILAFVKPETKVALRATLILISAFAIRYWLISAGQIA